MTVRQNRTYMGLLRLHITGKGQGNLFSCDSISAHTGIHRRSTHNDLQALIGQGKVWNIKGDGKRFYGVKDYR